MMESADGQFFSDALMRAVRERFHYVDSDFTGRKRLYFDNAGGLLPTEEGSRTIL